MLVAFVLYNDWQQQHPVQQQQECLTVHWCLWLGLDQRKSTLLFGTIALLFANKQLDLRHYDRLGRQRVHVVVWLLRGLVRFW